MIPFKSVVKKIEEYRAEGFYIILFTARNMRTFDGRAIPNFINQAIMNKKFSIYGDGNQTRSFTYIDDLILGIDKLLLYNYSLPMNIGSSQEYSINEIVDVIKSLIDCDGDIIYSKLPENDPKVRRPDITLAKTILNWEPKINLRKGIKKTIDYFYKLQR